MDREWEPTRRSRTRDRARPSFARVLAGVLVLGGLAGATAAAAAEGRPSSNVESAGAASSDHVVRSRLELAQAALSDGPAGVEVIVTAVDFVDVVEGRGTNTAVDVFFPNGECVATGPIDFRPDGLERAWVTGALTADCFDRDRDLSFTAAVTVDLAWNGFGRPERIPFPGDPSDPCRIHRLERRAVATGTVDLDGPDGGLRATARPTGDPFDGLARQRDVCRFLPGA